MVQLTHYHDDSHNAAMRALEGGEPTPPECDEKQHQESTSSTSASTAHSHVAAPTAAAAASAATAVPPGEQGEAREDWRTRFRKELRRRILHTTPSWFAVNMGTGITAILLHQLPYQFDGLETISNVIFALNVVLFALILALSIARYVIWPSMFWTMLYHPTQSLFLGTFPMGFTTIINMMVYSLVPAWGSGWLTAAHVLWWIDSAVAIVIAIGIPFVQFTRHSQSFDNISGVWFLPVVTTVVAAATGGTVASALIGAGQVDEARVVVVASYILWGTGVPLSMMLMTLYYARLAIYKIPPAAMIVSAFLPLGPCGQGAFGLLQLAADLVEITRLTGSFPLGGSGGAPGRGLDSESAHLVSYAMQGASILVALVIWGVGLVWLVLAVATIADMTAASFVPFNMGWWGYTFPLGTFATATTQLGRMLDSRAFLVLGTVLSAIVALLWLGLFVVTGWKAVTGTMFFSPCLAEQGGSPPVLVAPARKYAYSPRPPSQTRGASSLSPLPFNRSRNRSGARDASHDHHRDGVPRGPIERVLEVFIRDKSQDADRDADAEADRGRSQTRLDRSGGSGGGGGLQDDVVGGAGEVRTAEVRR